MRCYARVASLLSILGTLSGAPVAEPTGDRGYTTRSNAESDAATYALAGIEYDGALEAAAAARGRESAQSAGLKPQVKRGKKAESFDSPEAAVQAFITALRANDEARLESLFAAQPELLSSGDAIADRALRERFLREYDRRHSLEGIEAGIATLIVGESVWQFAVPIVQGKDGYYFNSAAGANEVVFRRIGRNELGAIDVCRGYVAAQREYALIGHDGNPAGRYAQKLMSDAGKQNGLFWPAGADALRSPAGPLLAAAAAEGYSADTAGRAKPYHGYLYRTLAAQPDGFALIAYPAEYGRSGVKSFVVNQAGVVYEKDLGKRTLEIARGLREFDPKGWSPAP